MEIEKLTIPDDQSQYLRFNKVQAAANYAQANEAKFILVSRGGWYDLIGGKAYAEYVLEKDTKLIRKGHLGTIRGIALVTDAFTDIENQVRWTRGRGFFVLQALLRDEV